ncbi:MAG: glycosyltransferase family 2 protein [Anaerolineaceae bacterium]|nr:glycosyltransferase family 2 protein [Anaerolineaceae bacterium]
MPTYPPILIILINWRQPQITVECVHSLQKMDYPNKQYLIVDNGSGDGSLNIFRQELPFVKVLALEDNFGFAKGANAGLRYAIEEKYQFALLINNDAFPKVDMLTKLLGSMEPDTALLSPKIYFDAEPDLVWFAGGQQHPTLLEVRNRGLGEVDGPKWQQSQDVDYLLGTCLLINLALVSQIGFFDERYFMYYEDLDLSLRCRLAGFRLRLVTEAHLYHRVATSSGGIDSPFRSYLIAKSGVIFFLTHHKHGKGLNIFFFRVLSSIRQVLSWLIRGNVKVAVAHIRGLRDGWILGKSATKS